ncbi:hypothetical protein [Caudoviricetes sp.]|nr:hypothetical protein [Caudoviricetes sp.]
MFIQAKVNKSGRIGFVVDSDGDGNFTIKFKDNTTIIVENEEFEFVSLFDTLDLDSLED